MSLCFTCGKDADRFVDRYPLCRQCTHNYQIIAVAVATEDREMLARLLQEATSSVVIAGDKR